MKTVFSIALILAVLNPFCCCWSAGGEVVQEAVAHHCCGGGDEGNGSSEPEHHDPDACPQQSWMQSKHVNAEVKAQAPVLLDLHMILPVLEMCFDAGTDVTGLDLHASIPSLGERPPPLSQLYCVRLL